MTTPYLTVGAPVAREDGRYYVPVSRQTARDDVPSQVMFRVASDAFTNVDEAAQFAELITEVINDAMTDYIEDELGDDD